MTFVSSLSHAAEMGRLTGFQNMGILNKADVRDAWEAIRLCATAPSVAVHSGQFERRVPMTT